MIQQQQQKTSQWVLTSVQFNLVVVVSVASVEQYRVCIVDTVGEGKHLKFLLFPGVCGWSYDGVRRVNPCPQNQ